MSTAIPSTPIKRISVDTRLWREHSKNPQSQRNFVTRGKEQGYSTYAEVNDHLVPEDIVDSDQIEDIIQNDQRHGYSGNGRSA